MKPLALPEDVVLIGRRDAGLPYGHAALARSGVLDIPGDMLAGDGGGRVAARALQRLGAPDLRGFWIHLDVDLLDPSIMGAVDSPEPGGPSIDELAGLVAPLVRHPAALGLQVTIYDPALDPDRSCATRLITLLETVLLQHATGGYR